MKRRTVDVSIERRIVIGMIVSTQFLRDIKSIYSADLMETGFARTVASWCLEYFDQHQSAPDRQIQDIFHHWVRVTRDDTQVELIEEFLGSLSDEHEHADLYNVEYHLRNAEAYFKEKSLKILAEDIQSYIVQGDPQEAERVLDEYERIVRPQSQGLDPFATPDAFRRAFESKKEPLFQLPGALGELINPQITRQSFIGWLGPEKRGKTFRLIDFAMQAWRQRCNVAVFSVGDMSEEQFVRRQGIYLCQRSDDIRYCGDLLIPVLDCGHNQDDSCTCVDRASPCGCLEDRELLEFDVATRDGYVPCTFCNREDRKKFMPAVWWKRRPSVEPITWRDAYREAQRVKTRNRVKGFRLSTHANSSINVSEINNILDKWAQLEDFVPDVLLIDYADILAPEPGGREFRHQQNDTWKSLRRLSQDWNCCVITATQADADSYDKKSLGLKNFSEDKRKYAHVTAMYGLNQTEEERKQRVMRINELLVREDAAAQGEVVVLQCLEIGRPHLSSFWKNKSKE